MTHLSPSPTGGHAVTPCLLSPAGVPSLTVSPTRLRDALAAKRAAIASLETRWVAASEAYASRGRTRMDDRSSWDKATWSRYLAAAVAHEPEFKPRIMQLLREIHGIETLLAIPGPRQPRPMSGSRQL